MAFLHMFSSALIMLVLISLLILIHEFGHFLAAKAVGVRVDKFGFGLPVGPTLFSKKIGETEILIHAFLLGGYVSFPDDEEDCDLPKDSPLRFSNKTIGQRMFVITAGVLFNIIFAFYLVFFTGLMWKALPQNKYDVFFDEYIQTAGAQAKASGFQKGDRILKINGVNVDYPVTVNRFFNYSKEFDGYASKDIIDSKMALIKELNPNLNSDEPVKIGTVVKLPEFSDESQIYLSLANITGIEKYDSKEEKLSDKQIELRNKINYSEKYRADEDISLYDIAAAVSDTKHPVYITVLRKNGDISEEKIFGPLYSDKNGIFGMKQTYSERIYEINNIRELTIYSYRYIKENFDFMAYTLAKLFTGKVPVSEMNGIIAITKIGTEIIAYKGIFSGLLLTAMISLNLAIINILPIPALDGGHLLFLIIEKVTGRPVSKKFVEGLSNFFFYLLVLFMLLILYNDIHAWITGKI